MKESMGKTKQPKQTLPAPTLRLRDMPLRLELPVREEFGGHIEALGNVGEIMSLARMVHSKGIGIDGSLRLIQFAIRLWTVVAQRPDPEEVFQVVWRKIFELFPHNIDWEKPSERWLAVTYVLLNQKPPLLTYPQAAALVTEELGRTFTEDAWRMRLQRFTERHQLPKLEIYNRRSEGDIESIDGIGGHNGHSRDA